MTMPVTLMTAVWVEEGTPSRVSASAGTEGAVVVIPVVGGGVAGVVTVTGPAAVAGL